MNSKDVDFLRKKVNSISYFRKILFKAPEVSSVKYVSKHLEIIGSLKDILMCTKKKTPLLKRQLEDAKHEQLRG